MLKMLTNAFLFASVAQLLLRGESKNHSVMTCDLEEEFIRKFDPISQEFESHRALNHPLFEYLLQQSKEGFTPKQYQIYRDNFFRRTELTIPSVARFIEKAALSGDPQAVVDTIRNLNDEGGYGDIEKMHSSLLKKSHNFHGMRVFNVDPIHELSDVAKSENLVTEVEEYRKSKQDSFEKTYPYIAGNTWAHELAADDMLDGFRKAFFEPYQGYYTPPEYIKITEFFTAHKDDSIVGGDVEKQHASMARSAAERACKDSLQNIAHVRLGGLEFLNSQAKLWDGLLREIENARLIGEVVEPKVVKPDSVINPVEQSNVIYETLNQNQRR